MDAVLKWLFMKLLNLWPLLNEVIFWNYVPQSKFFQNPDFQKKNFFIQILRNLFTPKLYVSALCLIDHYSLIHNFRCI